MEQDLELIKLVALICIIVFVAKGLTIFLSTDNETKKKECEKHDWSVNPKTNKFECCHCGFEAGSHKTDHGEY
jgi:hypothetical protein